MLKKKYSAIFIGTRIEALNELEKKFNVIKIITTKNSFIAKKYSSSLIINKSNKFQFFELIKKYSVDLILSAGFPYIIPQEVLHYYKFRIFVNSHPSLLPKYPGRKSINKAFYAGEKKFGCTLHLMEKNVDAGKVISQKYLKLHSKNIKDIQHSIFSKLEPIVIRKGLNKLLKKINWSINFRILKISDCKKSLVWRNNSKIWLHTKPDKNLKKRTFTIDDENEWFKKVSKKGRINLAIIYNFKEYIGNVYLTNMSKTSAGFEIFIGKHQKWNQGLGTKTLLNTIYLAKNKYNLKKLHLFVKKTNKPAINIYKRANFKMSKQKKVKGYHYMVLNLNDEK